MVSTLIHLSVTTEYLFNPLICLSNGLWPISTLKCHRHSKVNVSRTKQYTPTLLNETVVQVSITSLNFHNVHFPQVYQSNLCLVSVSSFAYRLHLFWFLSFLIWTTTVSELLDFIAGSFNWSSKLAYSFYQAHLQYYLASHIAINDH